MSANLMLDTTCLVFARASGSISRVIAASEPAFIEAIACKRIARTVAASESESLTVDACETIARTLRVA